MALDLLYVIAGPENSQNIVKDLLNVLWNATDEEFIRELALKICLIVEKHSINRRWHFDTILKVLVIADQAVKEESAKSLVYLVQATPQLQEYCMAKLFFSVAQNPQNDALGSVTLFLIGELSNILFRLRGVSINQEHILDLIESVIFKHGINNDTISYGLSCLLKLYEKFSDKGRIDKMIRSFEAHSDLQVQKRACEYTKLLEKNWDDDRKRQICVPVDPFKPTVELFKSIPIGDVEMDTDLSSLKMPQKAGVNYDDHITKEEHHDSKPFVSGQRPHHSSNHPNRHPEPPVFENKPAENKPKKDPIGEIDLIGSIDEPAPVPAPVAEKKPQPTGDLFSFDPSPPPQPPTQPTTSSNQSFDLMGFGSAPSQPPPQPVVNQPSNSGFGGDLLGFGSPSPSPAPSPSPPPSQIPSTQPPSNTGGMDLMGFGFSSGPSQPNQSAPQNQGFGFGNQNNNQPQVNQPPPQNNNNLGFDMFGGGQSQPPQPKPQVTTGFQPIQNTDPNKIMAYQNQHLQIWMNCTKQTHDTTKLFTTYINKTNNTLTNLTIQAAVVKHVKLTINPLTSTTLQPYSKQIVNQVTMLICRQ